MASPTTKTRARRAEQGSTPTWIKPQLAALVKAAPDGSGWLHEIKMDGYRMHARVDAGRVNILTRRGNDWTSKYPAIAEALGELPAKNAYLDGELCGVLPHGRTAFNLIQNASDTGRDGALVFFLFDPPVPQRRGPDGDAADRMGRRLFLAEIRKKREFCVGQHIVWAVFF